MSSAPTRIRLLLSGVTADGESQFAWAAWVAARDASAQGARIVLQRVSRKGNPESQPAAGLGYGETLRWFGPIIDDAARRLIIEYAEQVLAAGSFPPPGVELQALAWAPDAAPPHAASAVSVGAGGAGGTGSVHAANAGVLHVGAAVTQAGPAATQAGAGAIQASAANAVGMARGRGGIVLLSHAETDLLALNRAVDDLPAGFPAVAGHSLNGVTTAEALSALIGVARDSKLVAIVRVHGTATSVPGLIELVAEAQRDGWSVVVISGIGADAGSLPRTSNIAQELAASLTAYFMAGGVGNVVQGVRRVAHELLGVPSQFKPPAQMPAHGLYHPDLLVTSPEEWANHCAPNKPVALVLFYRAHRSEERRVGKEC